MEIKSSQEDQTRVLELGGRIDSVSALELEIGVQAALDALPPGLVLDFGGVNFLSSAGLRVMLSAAKRCRKQNTKLALHSLPPTIAEVFELGGLTAFLPIHADRDAALAAARRT